MSNTAARTALAAVLACSLLWTAEASAAGAFTFTKIAIPGGSASTVSIGITEDGTVVGSYLAHGEHVFTAKNGVVQTLATPQGFDAAPEAVSRHGVIAGGLYPHESYYASGFLYLNGSVTRFDYPGAYDVYVTGVNDNAYVVGYAYLKSAPGVPVSFLWHGGTFTTLPFDRYTYIGDINNAGRIVGTRDAPNDSSFFIYKAGAITNVPAPSSAFIFQNDKGEIAGSYVNKAGGADSFKYVGGTVVQLFPTKPASVLASAINDKGQIAGTIQSAHVALIFSSKGHGSISATPPSISGLQVTGINGAGQITGYWVVGEGNAITFVATPK